MAYTHIFIVFFSCKVDLPFCRQGPYLTCGLFGQRPFCMNGHAKIEARTSQGMDKLIMERPSFTKING